MTASAGCAVFQPASSLNSCGGDSLYAEGVATGGTLYFGSTVQLASANKDSTASIPFLLVILRLRRLRVPPHPRSGNQRDSRSPHRLGAIHSRPPLRYRNHVPW